MVCYIVPTIAALIHGFLRNKIPSWKNETKHGYLTLLLTGGAIFGLVDHWWNGELFLIGNNWTTDIALGFTITAAIIIAWGAVITFDLIPTKEKDRVRNNN